jgi:hypothetical protein
MMSGLSALAALYVVYDLTTLLLVLMLEDYSWSDS